MMEAEPFRAFVWRLLARAHVHETSFAPIRCGWPSAKASATPA